MIIAVQQYMLYRQTLELKSAFDSLDNKLTITTSSLDDKISGQKDELDLELMLLHMNLSSIDSKLTDEIIDVRNDYTSDLNSLTGFFEEKQLESRQDLENVKGELESQIKTIKVKGQDFTAIIDDALDATVSIVTNKGQGSGAIVDSRGFIVTNFHVIDGASQIRVLTYDKNIYIATAIAAHKDWDVVVLKIDEVDMPILNFANSNNIKVGEKVIALGNPAGYDFTVTEGIVSAVDRVGPNGLQGFIQTDVPLNPGNSGGPLVNVEGRIIGLNNFKIGGSESLGFAIPSNIVSDILDQVVQTYYE